MNEKKIKSHLDEIVKIAKELPRGKANRIHNHCCKVALELKKDKRLTTKK